MENSKDVPSGTFWQHVKGGVYQVVTACTIEETDTPAVMYKCLNVSDRDDFWVRPTDNFLERFKIIDLNPVQMAEILKEKRFNP
jgi:hypothetical protein